MNISSNESLVLADKWYEDFEEKLCPVFGVLCLPCSLKIQPRNRFRSLELIPPYNLWVEGDNANNSEDSGAYGAVSKKLLVGQAKLVVWPPSRWGRVEKIVPSKGRSWWT
jgi:hypothetical protein